MATNIKIIKLLNGQDLIANIVKDDYPINITINNPVAIVVLPTKTNPQTPTVGFAPWAEFSDDKEIKLSYNHILAMMTPVKEFISQYNSMFGGIVLPSNKMILPGTQ